MRAQVAGRRNDSPPLKIVPPVSVAAAVNLLVCRENQLPLAVPPLKDPARCRPDWDPALF